VTYFLLCFESEELSKSYLGHFIPIALSIYPAIGYLFMRRESNCKQTVSTQSKNFRFNVSPKLSPGPSYDEAKWTKLWDIFGELVKMDQ